MNYRHAYHAGNFADVLKHIVLARIAVHLRAKPAAFRIIDTHAGAGLYDLTGTEAAKTGEWREGIARFMAAEFSPAVRDLVTPYRDVVASFNPCRELRLYPGSPLIARALLRDQDRLTACELERHAAEELRMNLRGDARSKAVFIDGWTALGAYVPPVERRGLVLVDPPFERADEFARCAQALRDAVHKWPTGIYALWYPIKQMPEARRFAQTLVRHRIPRLLHVELHVAPHTDTRLAATGMMIANPPWRIAGELEAILPELKASLQIANGGLFSVAWLTGENPSPLAPGPPH